MLRARLCFESEKAFTSLGIEWFRLGDKKWLARACSLSHRHRSCQLSPAAASSPRFSLKQFHAMLALPGPFRVKNPNTCRSGWTEHSPRRCPPCRPPYLALRDLQLRDSWGTRGLNSAEDRSAAFCSVFPPAMVSA